jgi:hypothetical protein
MKLLLRSLPQVWTDRPLADTRSINPADEAFGSAIADPPI